MHHRSARERLAIALFACLFVSAAHADPSSSLEERMSYKDFTRYGLDKLTPEQLTGLNQWLQTHTSIGAACAPGTAPATATAAPAGSNGGSPTSLSASSYKSRLVGDFDGWEQGTVLTLENGQRWEVRDDEPVIGTRTHAPMVTVERGLIAGWRLSVDGVSDIAHVIPADTQPH